jgi:phosphoglycerol transferase MdoB-like AlkP superfamily enzyme
MQAKFQQLHLTDNLKELAREGVGVRNFLPASKSTMLSFSSILLGLQDYWANYQQTSVEAFPSSAASTFERLGYTPRLFYGGYPSWQRVELFARNQGFREFYSAPVMGDWLSTNEWGVDDEFLFDFVLNKIDPDTPSFNMILTTTFHPPYDIDIASKGFTLDTLPEKFKKLHTSKSVDMNMLGHLWYMDKSVGEFVKKAEAMEDSSLFAITGDHYGRRHLSANPTPYEFSSVPLVLYGKEALKGKTLSEDTAASHVDIVPTLVELSAPEGFEYYSTGTDIFDPERRPYGVGSGVIIGRDFILNGNKVHPLPFGQPVPQGIDMDELGRLSRAHSSIGWWRIMKGPRLPEKTVSIKK